MFTHRELQPIPAAVLSFISGDVAPVHGEMVGAAKGKNVWLVGGGDLVGQFADRGLLDEILLGVAPVMLGGGAPLLPRRIEGSELTFVDLARDERFAYLTYGVSRLAR